MNNQRHDEIRGEAEKLLLSQSSDIEVPDRNSTDKPDIRIKNTDFLDSDDFSEVWVEVETSTIAKPGYIVKRVYQAAIEDAKMIFAIPAKEDGGVDYYAKRIDTIVGPPNLVHKKRGENKYKLYTRSDYLRTEEDGYALIPADEKGEWVLEEKKSNVNYNYDSDTIQIDNYENGTSVSTDNLNHHLSILEDGYRIHSNGEVSDIDTLGELEEYRRVPKPIYPFDIPRTRIDKVTSSIEYLVFGENVVYRREHPNCEIYDIGA